MLSFHKLLILHKYLGTHEYLEIQCGNSPKDLSSIPIVSTAYDHIKWPVQHWWPHLSDALVILGSKTIFPRESRAVA